MLFCKPKKKNPAPKIIAIVLGSLALLGAMYVVFDKVLKKRLPAILAKFKKDGNGCTCEDLCIDDLEDAGEAFDIDGDETTEAVLVDTTGDGEFDTILADTTGDGVVDTILQ